ncbi:MAG: starch-binding protein [Muribaculaceae bacterium]|nr:starch-binding protein [Muribaculaceae bacterium]
MTRIKLTSLHGAVLVALLLLGSAPALADLTIKVQKGGEAPYLYAYTGSGVGATEYTGEWPGTQFTKKDGAYWTMTIEGVNQVNIILNMGENGPQTADYLNLSGIDGVISLMYDGNTTMFGTMPAYAFSASDVYFAVPPSWGTTYAIARNSGGGYEQKTMEEIGTDGMGLRILKTSFSHWNDTPNTIEFHDNTTNTSGQLAYVAGGYYNTSKTVAQFMGLTESAFPDENFRNAIKASTGMSSDVFTPSSITYLDVSNQGISSIKGIELFTNLQTLLAGDNSLSTVDLGNNPALEVLDLSGNSGLHGFTSNYANNSNQYINLAIGLNIKELYLADCTIGSFKAIKDHYDVSSLERLDLSGNTNMSGWSTGIAAQTGLKYLNVTNNAYGSDALKLTTLTQLDTLIADDNPNLGNISTLKNASNLRYVSLRNCGLTNSIGFGHNTKLEYIDISDNSGTAKNFTLSNNPNLKVFKAANAAIKEDGLTWALDCPALDTLIVSGNSAMKQLTTLHHATRLKYLDMSGGDLYLQDMPTFVGSNFPKLTYIDFSNDEISVSKTLDGFAALKTLKIGGNTSLPLVDVNNCPALETLDVSGNTALTTIGLTNQGYDNSSAWPTITAGNCSHLTTLDVSHNNYTSVPATLPFDCTSLYMNNNQLTGFAIPSGSPVEFLYAEANNFPAAMQLTAESTGSLKGLDLGSNGITSFKAEGTALSALMVGNNPQMTTLELHGNNNLTVTTAGTTMSDGSGLYLLGNTALKTIDLSNSSFTQIGANAALQGLTAVETLNGSHNKFTTFTNSNYNNGERLASYVAGKASLEHLTGLKHLDLSYNELADSVHLFRNTLLEYLDVSHNNVIGPLATTEAEKLAMRLKKADLLRKYHNKSTAIGISCPAATQATLDDNEAITHRAFDLRDIDLRDTTGLFHLDLNYNTQLKYLDISDTNIHNTAAGWWYMNPGWEFGTGGWYSTTTTSMSKSPANGSTRHHFVWLQTCGKLEEFHADNNNMQSLGVRTSPYLHTITAKGMYGDCFFMRDGGTNSNPNNLTERGNIGISGTVVTYSRTSYTTNTDGTLTGTVFYKDADGVEGGTNYYPNPVKWYDVSNSGYYAIRTANGVNLEHLDVSGNHLSELKVSGNTKLQYVDTENNDRLTYVDANDLPDLNTLKVADNPLLEKLYADNDPSLPGISGLEACTALKYLHVQNDGLLGSNNFNVLSNTNLQSLLASSCNLPGELKVSQCSDLDTLSVHNNQLTRLDVSSLQNMHWLNCYNNVGIQELSVAASTGMTHLDLHNCRVIDLALAGNTALKYFDCDDNKVRELTLAGAADIDTIHANRNNLFQLNLAGPHTKLKDLQFEHNHINGIDLTGCEANVLTNIQDQDNGRTITANSVTFYVKVGTEGNQHEELRRMYYFQLDQSTENSGGGEFLNTRYCTEDEQSDADTRTYGRGENKKTLAADGVNLEKITWYETVVGGRNKSRANDLGVIADNVIGTIVVLEDTSEPNSELASGREVYTYNNGVSDSQFYLNWTASSDINIVTGLDQPGAAEGITVAGGTRCITANAAQATTLTVYDLAGRVVLQRDIEAGQTVIDGLQPGIYIVAGHKVLVKD